MKKHPSLVILAIAAISIQCSIANHNLSPLPAPDQAATINQPTNEAVNKWGQKTIVMLTRRSPLIEILEQIDAFYEGFEEFLDELMANKEYTNENLIAIEEMAKNMRDNIKFANHHTVKFLNKEEDINDYLCILLQQRARNLLQRRSDINLYAEEKSDHFIQPTSLPLFKFLNNGRPKSIGQLNKYIRIATIITYEFCQLLIKETLSICDIESLDKKTMDILRASPSLYTFITNPNEEYLGHPDEAVATYHIIESILLACPKPTTDNKKLQDTNEAIRSLKKKINLKKTRKDKKYSNNPHSLIKFLTLLISPNDTTNPSLVEDIKYLSKDLDGEIIRNHFYAQPNGFTYELDENSNYLKRTWPYPLPRPAFLETAIIKHGPDLMPTPFKVIKSKPDQKSHGRLKPDRKKQPANRTTRTFRHIVPLTVENSTSPRPSILTNVESPTDKKDFPAIVPHSQHVEAPATSTLTNLESLTEAPAEKTDTAIIPSQLLQEKDPNSIIDKPTEKTDTAIIPSQLLQEKGPGSIINEPAEKTDTAITLNQTSQDKVPSPLDTRPQQVEPPTSLPSPTLTYSELPTDAAFEKINTEIISGDQPLQEKELGPLEAFPKVKDPISLPSLTLTNPELPIDEPLEKIAIEDYSIYYDEYNEYKNPKNYESKTLTPGTEKNVTEPKEELWKQPAGARRFNSNLFTTRETDFIITTHQETVNKIFDPKRQCKVKFREFVTLWESINGTITNSGHGGSHRKIIAPNGTVITGIFTKGNGTIYGKKSIQYLKMALEYVGRQPTK